jgi:hypothetical protein
MTKRLLALLVVVGLLTMAVAVMAQTTDEEPVYPECTRTVIEETTVVINPFFGTTAKVYREVEVGTGACEGINDGRVNDTDANAEAAIWCRSYGIDTYDIDFSGDGELAMRTTWAEIDAVPAKPEVNTLIEGVPGFALYRLTSGELQLNGPANWEGKPYVFIWDGCERPATSK